LNTYRPDVEPELNHGEGAQKVWKDLIYNAGTLDPQFDATAALIRQGNWKAITPERINELVDYATNVFSQTAEGRQFLKKASWIDKSKDPRGEMRKLVQDAGFLKTFNQTQEEYSNWQAALVSAESARKTREEAEKYQKVNPMTFQGYVKGNNITSYGHLENELQTADEQVAAAKVLFDTDTKSIRAKRGDFNDAQFDQVGNYTPAKIYKKDAQGKLILDENGMPIFEGIDQDMITSVFGSDYNQSLYKLINKKLLLKQM
jgi:hypothetical protein